MDSSSAIKNSPQTTMTAQATNIPSTRPRNASSTTSPVKSKKKSTSLPPETVDYLKNWMMSPEHIAHPYPTEQEKSQIMKDTGIELKQLTNWFVNNRKRYWKPRVEARLQEQTKAKELPKLGPSKRNSAATTTTTTTTRVPSTSPTTTFAPVSITSKAIAKVISNSSMTSLDDDKSHDQAITTVVTPMGSPGRCTISTAVSETSDAASVSSDEEVGEQEHTIRTDLHLLKPVTGGQPTEADMTTLSNISSDRILRSFKDCYFTYRIPANATLFQEQSRRDAELLRLKKKLLAKYFAEKNPESPKKRSVCALFEAVGSVSPRPKYRRVSMDLWRSACKTAGDVYDESLPSLEEATQLFGYNSAN